MRTVKITIGPYDADADGYCLSLEVDNGGPRVEVTLPQSHVASSRVQDDNGNLLTEEAIHDLLVREKPLPSKGELDRIGDYLGGLLGYGAVGTEWDNLRKRYPREDPQKTEGLSIMLEAMPRDLQALPWELTRRNGYLAFTDPRNPFARVAAGFDPNPPDEAEWWPLHVTVVVGAKADDEVVGVAQELDHFERALSKVFPDVEYREIMRPNEKDLQSELEKAQPHVLHFIGHGQSTGDSGVLVIHDEKGNRRWDWSADDIAGSAPVIPRIAVLNACRSDDARPQLGTWAVADAFLERGAYAVVAIQGDIEGRAAASFSAGLYEALMDDADIHVAVAKGRQRAMAEMGSNRRDFCLPTLKLARPPERVLPKRVGISQAKVAVIDTVLPRRPFVDRQAQRRDVLEYLEARASAGIFVLSVVSGEHDVGKTSLVQWALRQLALRGREVVYVDLRTPDDERRSAVDVLRAIRDGVHRTRPQDARGLKPLDEWTHALNFLVRGEPVPADPPIAPVNDEKNRFNADPTDLAQIFARFLAGMKSIANGSLLLALDHVDAVDRQEFEADICGMLIEPIIVDPDAHIGLLLSGVRVTEMLPDIHPGCAIPLDCFKPDEMLMLVRQYLRFHEIWDSKGDALGTFLTRWGEPWKPVEFEKWRELAGKVA